MRSWLMLAVVLLSACSSGRAALGEASPSVVDFRPGSLGVNDFGPAATFSDDGTLRVQSQGNPCAVAPQSVVVQPGNEVVIDYAQVAVPCWSSLTSYVTTVRLPDGASSSPRLTVRGIHQQPGINDFEIKAQRQ